MAALLYSRVSLPCTFVPKVPKISWIRNLSSDFSGNGNGAKVPVSSVLEKLKSSSAAEADLKSMLEKSIEETKSQRKKVFRRIAASTSESTGHTRQRPQRADKSLEDLDKSRLNAAERSKQDSSGNGNGEKVPASSLLEKLKSSSAAEADLSKISDMLSTQPVPEESKVIRSRKLKTGLRPKRANTKEWKYNKILREIRMQEDMSPQEKSLGTSESGNLLGVLKEAEQEPGQDDAKSMLEKSIEETRSRRKKVFRRIAASTSESTGYTRQRPQRVDKSLEDLDKSRLNAAERSKQDVDPSLNQKIRDLLSEVEIQPKQLGTAKTIVAAVENWGTTASHQRITLKEEHHYQTKEMSSMKRPSGLMLLEGESTGLFDNVISKAKTADAKINNVTQASFLYHLEELDNVDKIGYLGVRRNAFADQISLSNRLWQYPVDNEVCKIEEENTSFEEHVFLEYLLDDFPSKGPVRRFMELVINGLQKNPHLSVEQKKERVRWFHDYFSNFSEEELSF